MPDEEDHRREYQTVLDRMGDRTVVLRTIDLGGDKLPENDRTPPELNPFLGLRAVRLCLQRPELFRAQLRAMLAAGAGRDLRIMLPMICSVDEVTASRTILNELIEQRRKDGLPVPNRTLLGIMIEIPSAALQARALARVSDFFSIGTNDLVQYTLAVDRVNKMVANLYRPTHPAVLQLIKMVADAAREAGIPASVCGEMASDPRLAVLLVGLGIHSLSMGPSSIGEVKRALRAVSYEDAEMLARDVLHMSTPGEVEAALKARFGETLRRATQSSTAGAY